MRGFVFLLISFLVALQLQAQQGQDYSLEALDLLALDSLEIRNPVDTLRREIDNYEGKFSGLKEDLNTTLDLPDTLDKYYEEFQKAQEEEGKKKAEGANRLLNNASNLEEGTYKWNGSAWVKE